MDPEQLLQDLTGKVRDALSEAEARAREIVADAEERARSLVADAEREAKLVRERAEAEADQRLARVREALAGLEGALTGEVEPGPAIVPEPTPPDEPEPYPPPVPEPMPPAEPEPLPPSPEIEPPAPAQPDRPAPEALAPSGATEENGAEPKGDDVGARIVATKMALDGAAREEIASHLAEHYEVADLDALVDDALARAMR